MKDGRLVSQRLSSAFDLKTSMTLGGVLRTFGDAAQYDDEPWGTLTTLVLVKQPENASEWVFRSIYDHR
jgi:hypothetical protein